MQEMTNFDNFDAPCISFSDLPQGMGEKVKTGDTIISKCDAEEVTAEVVEVDSKTQKIYLTKEIPIDNCELSVKETSTGQTAPFDAIKKEAMRTKDGPKDVLTGPLPNLKKFLIQISIEEGQ